MLARRANLTETSFLCRGGRKINQSSNLSYRGPLMGSEDPYLVLNGLIC